MQKVCINHGQILQNYTVFGVGLGLQGVDIPAFKSRLRNQRNRRVGKVILQSGRLLLRLDLFRSCSFFPDLRQEKCSSTMPASALRFFPSLSRAKLPARWSTQKWNVICLCHRREQFCQHALCVFVKQALKISGLFLAENNNGKIKVNSKKKQTFKVDQQQFLSRRTMSTKLEKSSH